MYVFKSEQIVQKILFELSKQPIPNRKRGSLLQDIRGGWYVNILGQKLPPLKKSRLRKINQKRRG